MRLRLPLVALLFLLLTLSGGAAGADSLGRGGVGKAVVVVGGDFNYPPYEFVDHDGKPAGFNVELTRAIAEVMGFKVEISLGPWDGMRRALEQGDVDILQGMAFSQERTNEVDFSTPHALLFQSIWIRRDDRRIRSIEEVRGKEVIVMKNSIMHDFMKGFDPKARLILTDTLAEALRLLNQGRGDCALVSRLTGMYLEKEMGLKRIVPVAEPIMTQAYGYAVKKGNAEVLARFNEGLAILKRSGQFQEIHNKWLGVMESQPVSWARVVRYVTLVSLPLLLILGGTVVWSRTLQKRVAQRTEELAREVAEKQAALEKLRLHQDQLVQADKLASLGTLVAGVAHEINNPNGLILLNLPRFEEVLRGSQPILDQYREEHGDFKLGRHSYDRLREELPHMLSETQDAAKRIKRIVAELKDFARRDSADLTELLDLNQCAQAALRLVENTVAKSSHQIVAHLADTLPRVKGNSQRIEQVIVNLLLNASQSLQGSGKSIQISTRHDRFRDLVLLTVRDEGRGVEPEHLARLTDPFFTTKREEGGCGLGLSISAGIVKQHGGTLNFDSQPGFGTTVTMELPALQSKPTPEHRGL
ncbi:transporter substrate-binding domain-containing protein [Geomonas paludis]|uniref:histidine kinase n=1 Tax=Geomonas paludis TaxID=2740185 RepID=A0A6V8N1G8_9BACT|nr:transporter substrate-binding domain-containing protein [Geomonas paludis]UPU37204.1 transporter substrate-binding domain-containing protein [Geomonas paludis]GFO66346.1 histidine kinase [Geomonas paludis]